MLPRRALPARIVTSRLLRVPIVIVLRCRARPLPVTSLSLPVTTSVPNRMVHATRRLFARLHVRTEPLFVGARLVVGGPSGTEVTLVPVGSTVRSGEGGSVAGAGCGCASFGAWGGAPTSPKRVTVSLPPKIQ